MRSYAPLADADSRRPFFRSLRDVIDLGGQALSALGRLHHAGPTTKHCDAKNS